MGTVSSIMAASGDRPVKKPKRQARKDKIDQALSAAISRIPALPDQLTESSIRTFLSTIISAMLYVTETLENDDLGDQVDDSVSNACLLLNSVAEKFTSTRNTQMEDLVSLRAQVFQAICTMKQTLDITGP